MTDAVMLYMTCANVEEARIIARELLEKHLIACANILGNIESHYRWKGALTQGSEVAMTAKTTAAQAGAAIALAKNLHSYELPCIIALPIAAGFPPFIQWVAEETAKK